MSPPAFPGLWQLACSLSSSDTVDLLKSRSGSKHGCSGLLQLSGKEDVESIRETQEKQKRGTGVPMTVTGVPMMITGVPMTVTGIPMAITGVPMTVTGHKIPLEPHEKHLDRFSEFLQELSMKNRTDLQYSASRFSSHWLSPPVGVNSIVLETAGFPTENFPWVKCLGVAKIPSLGAI